MKPIRVLQVVTIMNRGGLETMLMNYYRQLDRTRIQFDFIVHRKEEGHYDKQIENLGGRIFRMPSIKPGNYRTYFKKLDEFFYNHKEYKVVHSHINENSSFVLKAAKKAGVPGRIAHSHLSDLGMDLKLPFRLYARSKMKNVPTDYFACSTNAGKWLFGQEILNNNRLTVLHNAVNAEEFRFNPESRKHVRKRLGIRDDEFVIGHIGRFNKQKNHDFLIDIFESVRELRPESKLLLIGEGNLRPGIERKVMERNLDSNVCFLGIRSDIPQLLQAMDLFLFPSLFEGLPVVLIEAQASGLTCVVSETITKESDVTGRVEFKSLKASSVDWAKSILKDDKVHVDTTRQLKKSGYDTTTMVNWLSRYYASYYGIPYKANPVTV